MTINLHLLTVHPQHNLLWDSSFPYMLEVHLYFGSKVHKHTLLNKFYGIIICNRTRFLISGPGTLDVWNTTWSFLSVSHVFPYCCAILSLLDEDTNRGKNIVFLDVQLSFPRLLGAFVPSQFEASVQDSWLAVSYEVHKPIRYPSSLPCYSLSLSVHRTQTCFIQLPLTLRTLL